MNGENNRVQMSEVEERLVLIKEHTKLIWKNIRN